MRHPLTGTRLAIAPVMMRLLRLTPLLALIVISILVNAQTPVKAQQPPAPAEEEMTDSADLIETIKLGDLPAVSNLLFAGASPDAPADDGTRPLCWAVRVNRGDIVQLLLDKGADVNAEEDDEGTAVFGSARRRSSCSRAATAWRWRRSCAFGCWGSRRASTPRVASAWLQHRRALAKGIECS